MVTVQLIRAFVFATQIVQFLFFLNPKFQASYHLLWLYTAWFVSDLVGNPEDRFCCDEAHDHESFHNENMPMQYTASFHGYKNNNFQMKNSNIFLIFAQNIDCGYSLEPPHWVTASLRRF